MSGRSPIEGNPIECVSLGVCDIDTTEMRQPWPLLDCCAKEEEEEEDVDIMALFV